jgi:hypothetical protein
MADMLFPYLAIGGSFAFGLAIIAMGLWVEDRKKRRLHEENMLALQRGLLPPQWQAQASRPRKGWLGLAIGLPVFIACALAYGTFQLVDANRWAQRDLTGVMIAMWIVGGAVGLGAVIIGGIGLMADQRQHYARASQGQIPQVRPAPPAAFEPRDPGTEQIWKQERP